MRTVVACSVYPLAMVAAIAVGVVAAQRGTSPALVVGGATAFAVVVLIGLERWIPYAPAWQRARGDVRTDLLHAIVSGGAVEIIRALALGGLAGAATWLAARIGAPLWPRAWPLWSQATLAIAIGELGSYWAHRLQHRTRLWRFHAVHHSAERLYWLNAQRTHPFDHVFTMACSMAPLVLLGAGAPALLPYATCSTVHMLFQHANVDLRLGPLNWLVSSNEIHRWHHVSSRAMDCNYGAMLLVWDVVFGTRHAPRGRDVAIADVAGIPGYPRGYLSQLARPFRGG